MELQAVPGLLAVGHGGERQVLGGGQRLEAVRQGVDVVAVRHPHLAPLAGAERIQQRMRPQAADPGRPELPPRAGAHRRAEAPRQRLHAVADAEHRDTRLQHRVRHRRMRVPDRGLRPARQDHPGGAEGADRGRLGVAGVQLAVAARLAHAPGDQLRVLRAVVQHQDALGAEVRGHAQLSVR